MSSPKEELELVADEGDLRPGDLCVSKLCVQCGGSHRFMLMRRFVERCRDERGERFQCWWDTTPDPHAPPDPEDRGTILSRTIREGRLYRVRTGLEKLVERRKSVTA